MNHKDNLVRIFTGNQITISHLKAELESAGIPTLIKDEFSSGITVGFVAGVPSAIDLYIQEKDLNIAEPILKTFN